MSKLKSSFDRALLAVVSFSVTVLISLDAFFTRKRMSHENGIVGRDTSSY